jgi:hypothetical protein
MQTVAASKGRRRANRRQPLGGRASSLRARGRFTSASRRATSPPLAGRVGRLDLDLPLLPPPPAEHRGDRLRHVALGRPVMKRPPAHEQLGEQDGEREQVGPPIEVVRRPLVARVEGLEMLGRHVGQAAAEVGGRAVGRMAGQGAGVEVAQVHAAVGPEQDVGRLDVAVEHARRVGMGERVGELDSDPGHDRRPG